MKLISIFCLVLVLVLTAACAASPTPAPSTAPLTVVVQPSSQPAAPTSFAPAPSLPPTGPTRSPITVINLQQNRQPDGSIKTTASVTAQQNLGLGQMELASPETMLMGETRTIRLKISPATSIASSTPVAAPGKTPDLPKFVYRFSGNVDLYPIMIAELRTLSFQVDKPGPIRRDVSPNIPVTWDWIVSPRSPGRQELAIEISIPAVINGVDSELSTLQDVPLAIDVQSPIPTPVPFGERVGESIVNNSGAIIVALIGMIGTLIGILVKIRFDQDKAGPKKPKR
jgi:hypothetical protein